MSQTFRLPTSIRDPLHIMIHTLVPYYLLLRLIDHNDQIITACDCKTAIKVNVHREESPFLPRFIISKQVLLSPALATVSEIFSSFLFTFSSHSLLHLLSFFLPLSSSQQWKSLFDKVCNASVQWLESLTVCMFHSLCEQCCLRKLLICV